MKACVCILLLLCALLVHAREGNVHASHAGHEKATNHWAVELKEGVDPDALAAAQGFINLGRVGNLPHTYLFHKNTNTRALKPHLRPIHEHPHVRWAENQVSRKRFTRAVPTDPLFRNQWHLQNPNGVDVHVLPVWERGITGDGVTIAMVDDGLQRTHPDISPNYVAAGSYDFNENDAFPDPHSGDDHGTSAGGVAAAKANNGVCGSGAAPDAKLTGIRLIADYTTDAQEAAGLSFRTDINQIYSNSWGPNDDGKRLEKPGRLTLRAMEDAVTNGRGGKGAIYVWAGGNGRSASAVDNCNYDGYANSRFTIAIGAVDYMGKQSFYSENCAALIASAPSSGSSRSITTTDLIGGAGTSSTECTSSFGGTSAAAPLVAGVVALIVQANPNLGWRDVQHVLVNTSRMTDPSDADWITNGAGFRHNHKYGFGIVDAAAAVESAISHLNFPAPRVAVSPIVSVGKPIIDFNPLESVYSVEERLIVETVEVTVTAQHSYRGNLYITITSPSGTTSVLQEVHGDRNANIDGWTYTTVRSWGESSEGDWIVRIEDRVNGYAGSWTSWQLNVHGH